jgi:selenide,water dikinase
MLAASEVGACLNLKAVPALPGALELSARGITSSLQPDNLRLRRLVENAEAAAAHPSYPLLFDPQTAGGLLAGVPQEFAVACLRALRAAGHPSATCIGTVEPGGVRVRLVGNPAG